MTAGYTQNLRLTIRRGFDFSGRSSRSDAWTYLLVAAPVVSILSSATARLIEPPASGWLSLAIALICALPAPALVIRRFHDFGRSGWWSIALVPGVLRWLLLDSLQRAFGWGVRAAIENVIHWLDWAIFPAFALAYLALLAWPGTKHPQGAAT